MANSTIATTPSWPATCRPTSDGTNSTPDTDLLAAQRRERTRIRSDKGHRWGQPRTTITEAA